MPMIRYELRNEYSLADPELYRAADKDDPEALLEGVAMAGLVGVLRQLGDLAEFAAEIFHNLHEEVMATAARGHSLMVRIEQLETEVPTIERAFLSKTDHSSFFYNNGIDWRSNLRMDENLVTQGDLPRFIMDSYEECRPPPRLFLLDKFDVAGAGACLKRYTDPSFFKVETSRVTNSDVQRERKIMKPKKKGSRWRNGETPESIPTSSTKLHQLLSEERPEYGVSNPSCRVKLKRKLNGFPFDSKSGKSYMEKLLKSASPDHKLLDDVNENALPSPMLSRDDQNETRLELHEVRSMSTDRESVGRKRSPPSLPDREELVLNPSIYDLATANNNISSGANSYDSFAQNGISSSTIDKVTDEKVIAVDAESRRERRSTGYESDGISSDAENFVDAPLTIESDTDTETNLGMKSDFGLALIKGQQLISDANKEHINYRSSDSRSTGDSMISDERKEISSFSFSDSPSNSAENPLLEKPAKGFPSNDNPEIEIGDSSFPRSAGKSFPVDQHSQPVVSYSIHSRTNSTNSGTSDFELPTSRFRRNESISSSWNSEPGVVTKYMLRQPASDETGSTLDDSEKEANTVRDTPCHPSISDSEVPRNDESDHKDGNLVENRAFKLNKFNARSRRTIGSWKLGSSKNLITGKSDNEVPKLLEDLPSGHPDTTHHKNTIAMTPLKENLICQLDNEDSETSINSSDHFSGMIVESLGKKLYGTSSPDAQTADAEENCSDHSTENQITSETLILSLPTKLPDYLQPCVDANVDDIIHELQTAVHENSELGPSKSCELVASRGAGIADHVSPNDLEVLESAYHHQDKFEGPAEKSDPPEVDGISLPTKVSEFSDSADLKSLNETCVGFDESDLEQEKSGTVDVASSDYEASENAVVGNAHLHVGLEQLVEEHTCSSENSGLVELDNDNNCLTGIHADCPGKVVKTFGLPPNQLDQELPQMSPKFSPLFFKNHPQMLDQEDHRGASDSAFTTSLVACPNSQSVTKPQIESNDDIDVSGHPRDSLGSKLTPSHETNQINLLDLPPLPPLPPMEWRMGKLQHASSSTMVELKKLELSQQFVSPLTASTDGISSTLRLMSADDRSPSLPIAPISDVSSSIDKMQHSLVQTATKAASEKVEVDNNCSKLVSNDNHETDELLVMTKTKQQLVMPTSESDSAAPVEESGASQVCSNVELPHPCHPPVKDAVVLDKNQPREVTEQYRPQLQKVDERDSRSEEIGPKDLHKTIDISQDMERNQQQFVMPTLESASVSPAEDGGAHGSHTGKLPQPDATVFEDANLDKSQPWNDLEHGAPEVQKVEERDPLTEQISAEDSNETIDYPPVINSMQQPPIMPASESESMPPAGEDRVAHGSCAEKLPVPCNPPREDAATFDKSQITEVAEQVEPQLPKDDENILLQEIRTEDTRETTNLPPMFEGKQQQAVMPTPVNELLPQSKENEAADGSCTVGQRLPHDPLVEDASVLDKNKLKKVTERAIPLVPKLDDNNPFLEQIRSKSFNLKRTTSSLRPSVLSHTPTTNRQIAAIVEKANAIRQAMAGSDEDDDDSWSDS